MGFLKLYLSTWPIDIQPITQDSPFNNSSRTGRAAPKVDPPAELWGTQMIKLIQKRAPPYIQEDDS